MIFYIMLATVDSHHQKKKTTKKKLEGELGLSNDNIFILGRTIHLRLNILLQAFTLMSVCEL